MDAREMGHFEPIKNVFDQQADHELINAWCETRNGRIPNAIYFKKKPSLLLGVTNWKGRVPDLNYIWFDFEASEFLGPNGIARLKRIVSKLITWSGAVYATAWSSEQKHYRSVPGNPTKRLDQLNWLTYFGRPYTLLLDLERIRQCPFFSCEEIEGGLMLTASVEPNSPEMTESNETLLHLETCVAPELFATDEYPAVPCRVPNFDLHLTVV